jgi:hypothetical protein
VGILITLVFLFFNLDMHWGRIGAVLQELIVAYFNDIKLFQVMGLEVLQIEPIRVLVCLL